MQSEQQHDGQRRKSVRGEEDFRKCLVLADQARLPSQSGPLSFLKQHSTKF